MITERDKKAAENYASNYRLYFGLDGIPTNSEKICLSHGFLAGIESERNDSLRALGLWEDHRKAIGNYLCDCLACKMAGVLGLKWRTAGDLLEEIGVGAPPPCISCGEIKPLIQVTDHPDFHDGAYCAACNPWEVVK